MPKPTTRRRIQLELPNIPRDDRQFMSALNDRFRRIQQALDELDFPPALQTVINSITQGTGLCVIQEPPEGAVNGINREFFTTHKPSPALIWVQVGGLAMNPFGDYVLTADEGKIEFTAGNQPRSGEEIWVWYFCGDAIPPAIGVGTARLFAGGDERINYGNDSAFNLLGDVSVGVWVKFQADTPSPSGAIIGYGYNSPAESHPYILMSSGSSGNWGIRYGHDPGTGLTFPAGVPDNAWRYVGASRNSAAKEVTVFVGDGESIIYSDTQSYTNDPVNDEAANSRMQVGNSANSPAFGAPVAFIGTIQEHYVWGRTTTEADHLAAMQGNPDGTSLVLSVGPNLGDNPEIDDSGNGFTGAVTGTVLVPGHP